jgi:hypothetical protein
VQLQVFTQCLAQSLGLQGHGLVAVANEGGHVRGVSVAGKAKALCDGGDCATSVVPYGSAGLESGFTSSASTVNMDRIKG